METIYKTNFRVGGNLINLIRKEDGYAVTNRGGKDLGFICKTFGWCLNLINNKNVASDDESLILSILPFVKIKRHRCKKSKNRRTPNQIISNRGDNVINNDYLMSEFKKYSVENQLTKGFKSENVAKFYEFAGMLLNGCSFKEATEKVGISNSGANKWRKRVLGFIEKH